MSAQSVVSQVIFEPSVILSSDIIVPSSKKKPHSFCFATCTLLMNFYRYLSGVSLFWNRLVVSCLIFHVVMQMFFPLLTLNEISFIIFRSSTELLLLSIFFQSSFPLIFVRRLSVHCPGTSQYNVLALLVSAHFSFAYALTFYLYMYFSTPSAS